MTASEFAKIADAREWAPNKWVARCKAHADRRPSLSIGEGRDHRVLVRCFAECKLVDIVAVYGLKIGDLFEDAAEFKTRKRDSRPLIVIAEEALQAELSRVIANEAKRLGYEPPLLAMYENRARCAVERRLDVKLTRRPEPWCDVLPHAVDPAWSFCLERALEEYAWRTDVSADWLAANITSTPRARDQILDRAAVLLHEIAAAQ